MIHNNTAKIYLKTTFSNCIPEPCTKLLNPNPNPNPNLNLTLSDPRTLNLPRPEVDQIGIIARGSIMIPAYCIKGAFSWTQAF